LEFSKHFLSCLISYFFIVLGLFISQCLFLSRA